MARKPELPEAIIVKQTPSTKGEHEGVPKRDVVENVLNVPNAGHKRKEPPPAKEPRHMRGIRKDYQKMADPFSNDDDDKYNNIDLNEFNQNLMFVMMAEARDEFQSLKQARESPNWLEWEIVIRAELVMLREKETSELVDLPKGTIPLKNKWVFILKQDREGTIIRYKARLVIKGCGQRLGFDYLETHSPVVHMESIHAVLAIATQKHFLIQQMDVKGAYLNGTLKETIYMRQPEGFEDGSGKVCHLKKTLYGLKQSGCEWNVE